MNGLKKSGKRILSMIIFSAVLFTLIPQNISYAEGEYLTAAEVEGSLAGESVSVELMGVNDLSLMWPIKNYYRVDSGFGTRTWDGKFHGGIDIFRPSGTPIYAAQSGTAVASYHSSWGNNVLIDHGNGYKTRYAHMSRFEFSGTKWVEKGSVIGYVGKTGNAAGNHLHFEIYENGTRINPVPVNYDGRHSYGGSAPCNQAVRYVYEAAITLPPAHTHSWQSASEDAHPHLRYNYCTGCGEKSYTGGSELRASCKSCYPLGNVSLTRSFDKVRGTASFNRNNVSNAHAYTLKLYRDGGIYGTYNMSGTSYSVSGLPAGSYSAELTAKNNNTGESRSTYCSSFKIVNTYTVSYNANGGSGAPSSQTKIQDADMTVTTAKPYRAHYVFKGWAASRTATAAQYQPGGVYTKNAKITLYAVWEPETYTVDFDVNGGIGFLESETVTYGNTIKMPNSIVKEYSYLIGWSADKNDSNVEYALGLDHEIKSNMTLYAIWGNAAWNSEVSASIDGKGTKEEPYLISTAADLAYLANKVNTQTSAPTYEYYKLTNNINLAYTEWVPIGIYGNENQYFYGSFDGNGYTISDLYITDENQGYVGLFGYVKDSEIKNLTVTGAIESISSSNTLKIGGIISYADNAKLVGLSSKYFNIGSIATGTADYSSVGAVAGKTIGGIIDNCESYNSNINLKSGKFISGMIAGYCGSDITNCRVESTEGGLFSTSAAVGSFYIGGLCGTLTKNADKCIIKAPYFSNNIKTTSYINSIGGLVGELSGTAKICSVQFDDSSENSITSTGTGTVKVGGFVGNMTADAKITDCKFDGKTISGTSTSHLVYAGGLAGDATAKTNPTVSVNGGQSLSSIELPKKDGYKATWYTDSAFTTPYDFSQILTKDITLYAKWEKGDDTPDIWDGTSTEPAYNADTKTYTITNGEELAWVSDVTNGVITSGTNFPTDISFSGYTIELANDIYLNDTTDWESWSETVAPKSSWKSISSFTGVFNGKNYCINGMYICHTVRGNEGLFSSSSGTVKNLRISQSGIFGDFGYGGCIGMFVATNNGKVANCFNYGKTNVTMFSATPGTNRETGGIVGYNKSEGVITNCCNVGSVSSTGSSLGGIVGLNEGTVEKCYNNAKIIGENNGNYLNLCGGVCGDNYGHIKYCYNAGYIKSECYAGGIVGYCKNGLIANCYNAGSVEGGRTTGGILGYGYLYYNYSDSKMIQCCYNIGELSGSSQAGICGKANAYVSQIVICYAYSNTVSLYNCSSDDVSANNVMYLSNSKLKNLSNLTGFSTSDWATASINNGYPYLRQLEETYKKYTVTAVVDEDNSAINRAFVNVDGDISATAGLYAFAGSVLGYGCGSGNAASVNKNIVGMADNVLSETPGSSYTAYSGNVIGRNLNISFENVYYNSEMNVESSTNTIDTTGIARSSKTMNMTFYTNLLGLTPYTSIDGLQEDENAVWVLKNGELPELYYNVLNDITISADIENGSVTADRAQAVDGEIVSVTAEPAEGYVLNKIYVNGSEIAGATFEVSGDADIYAIFAEKTPEYTVTVTADDNASATLTNADEGGIVLMSGGAEELTVRDGDEVRVTASADENYTVDSVCVNGEEIAADSFIATDNSTVTLTVSSLSTDIGALTNEAEDISYTSAVVSGSLDAAESGQGYIRYWSEDDADTVYTTEPSEGSTYRTELQELVPGTVYYYQMTENGNIKSFKTLTEESDGEGDDPVTSALTSTVCTKTAEGVYAFDITADESVTTETLVLAVYNSGGRAIDVKMLSVSGGKAAAETDAAGASYAKIFVWGSGMRPKAAPEKVEIK